MFDPEAPLIEGYQLAFTHDVEPTSSQWDQTLWTPVFDPNNPGQPLDPVRFGTREVDVSLPDRTGDFWLAARVLYADCTLNGSFAVRPDCAVTPPQSAADPVAGTHLSKHCGPVRRP